MVNKFLCNILRGLPNLNGYNIVLTNPELLNSANINYNVHVDVDPRSATFYAYSIAKLNNGKALLVLSEEQLTDAYTALTESWMQSVGFPIIVYNSTNLRNTMFLERCTEDIIESEDVELIVESLCKHYSAPYLIKTRESLVEEKNTIPSDIQKYAVNNPQIKIITYNSDQDGLISVAPKYKSGIITKYIGYVVGSSRTCILVIPEKLLAIEANSFTIRDLPKAFKLVVLGDKSGLFGKLTNWIAENSVNVLQSCADIQNDIAQLVQTNSPTVLYI